MERTSGKQKTLKKRMLFRIALVLAISMSISSLIGYLYFDRVVKQQKIADEKMEQEMIASQLAYLTEDIDTFSKSIIVDEILQNALLKTTCESEYERLKNVDEITKRLVFYNSVHTYVASSFLKMEDGRLFSSSYNSNEENYIQKKFEEPQIQSFEQQEGWVYSNPYSGMDVRATDPVICYRTKMWSKESYGEQEGTLYVEIYLEHFLQQIEEYGQQYDHVCLIGNDGTMLYKNDRENRIGEYLKKHGNLTGSKTIPISGGYLICESMEDTGWTLCTLITNEYLWSRLNFVLKFFALSFCLTLCLLLFSMSKLLDDMTRPITKLSKRMGCAQYDQIQQGEIVHTGDEIQTLYESYNQMVREIQRGMEERISHEKQKKEMEFDIMLSQVNPHYLYNVLNTIVYLAAASSNQDIVKITNALIYSLQTTLNLGNHTIETTIEDELKLTDCYVQIQKYRYPEMFEVEVHCPEKLKGWHILKTSIQPLVENALLHGILPSEKAGKICVNIKVCEEGLLVTVTDDGVGISEECIRNFQEKKEIIYRKDDRKHIGISNIRDRIDYLYGAPYYMKLSKGKKGGTEVMLLLPATAMPENESDCESEVRS